jgi:TonB family protein
MRAWRVLMLSTVTLAAVLQPLKAAAVNPGSSPVLPAHLAWRVDPLARCPDLRVADDGPLAVVVFYVDEAGRPSQPSIKVSSQSEQLDAAAISCVMRLRFQPATRFGDGVAVESWQQMAWRWAAPATPPVVAVVPAAGPPAALAATSPSPVNTPAQEGAATIRVCTDEAGQLTQPPTVLRSSGDATLDAAALKITKAGSGSYRPGTTVNGKPLSGCAQVTIRFETR